MSPSPPRALLFDFGGTLDAPGVPWKERFFRIAREEGLEVPRETFDPAFYGATDSLEGVISPRAGLRETVDRVAGGLAARLGREESLLRRIGARFFDDSSRHIAESAQLLSRLRPHYRTGVVSNFYGNLQAVLDESGLAPWIEVAVDSTQVGCKKPDPRIFRAALEALETTPERAIFVGDSLPRDMQGARAMGMRHVWIRPAEASGNGGPCCPEDKVIARFGDLLEMRL